MARGKFYHDPARKHIEQYQDFSGGLNTMSTNDNLKDNELIKLENVDLGDRGSLIRRKGFKSTPNIEADGKPQMIAKYYRRYAPYNLLGIEGAFDGKPHITGNTHYIGNWYLFTNSNPDYAYKVPGKESRELIVNGNFENGNEGWNLTRKGSHIGESSIAGTGDYVLRIFRDIGDDENGFFKNEYQSDYIEVQEGDEIYMEAMYRRAASMYTDKNPYRVHLQASIHFNDGRPSERHYISKYDTNSTWQKISGYFKMPKGAVRVYLGVGMFDPDINLKAGVYFDNVFARREIQGTENSAVAIRANIGDTRSNRGLGLKFNGIEPNKYYVYLVDYKSDGQGIGAMAVRDERFGSYPEDDDLIIKEQITDNTNEWTTKYIKFQSYEGMKQGRAYVYNDSPIGDINTVYFDNARIYEVTADVYHKIGNDPEYSGDALGDKFPFRIGQLRNEAIEEVVTAIGGTFYVNGKELPTEEGLLIQTERSMEAVNYGQNLYIASGSGLLVYNGSTIKKVTPYIPDPLETLYIGTNGLIENPYDVSDEEQSVVEIQQIQFSRRYGVTNEFITIQVGVGKPSSLGLEYKFERRNVRDKEGYWFTIRDWHADNHATFITDIAGEYQFKISVREKNKELVLDEYLIPRYIIKPASEAGDIPIDANTIDLCNRILVHWDRLIVYGDVSKPDIVYISDLQNPAYFPMNNTLQFNNPRKERITSIVPYRDSLAVFTPSSIQALYGTNPENYERVMLNTDIGCIADYSAKVVQNHIMFLSQEGVAVLKALGFSESKANVTILDHKVKNLVSLDENALAYVRNNQYCLVFPSEKRSLRYYYNWDVWTQDTSDLLDLASVFIEHGKLIALANNGSIIQDADDYKDDEKVYDMIVGTKLFYFGEPYAVKKTRELQIMVDKNNVTTSLDVVVVLDQHRNEETITINGNDEVYDMAIPGRGLSVQTIITHRENKPFKLSGLGFIFKLKNP